MGGITSQPLRILRNWNVENRAFRVIEKQKEQPRMAPRYPTDQKVLARRGRQEAAADSRTVPGLETEKEPSLDERLKTVKVYSHDVPSSRPPVEYHSQTAIERDPRKDAPSSRPLPEERQTMDEPEYGFPEPEKVMPGKITFKNALELMALAQHDPVTYNAEHLASVYNMRPEDVADLVRYFKVFTLFIPKTKTSEEKRIPFRGSILSDSSKIEKLRAAITTEQDARIFLEGNESYKLFVEGRRQLAEEAKAHPEPTTGAAEFKEMKGKQEKDEQDRKMKHGRHVS
ncbi:hypothetical protein RvY_08715 [Ramazzottius varieornatus]|uniref:Uncharacterized protein n=1 Tax=Ramazzottius varieornatus TaxID=947166 RepID=A0A1D1V6U6_RAMVA|nr:hypothetical protein RvY_08715 [Ramazzottius varieornatus]